MLVLDSRGSGGPQGLPSAPGKQFLEQLREDEFGSMYYPNSTFVVAGLANPYPAPGSPAAMLAAAGHLPWWYHTSVVKGKKWLDKELHQTQKHCPATQVFLSGYSQGAQVAGDVFRDTTATNISGVALFGDPYFNPEDPSDHGNFKRDLNGLLGEREVFDSSLVFSFCHWGDPICQGKSQLRHWTTNHKDYDRHHEPQFAANQLANL